MTYRVAYGESPAAIARNHGVSVDALIRANPHKPTTVVAGKRTWSGIRHGEQVHIPTRGALHGLGAIAPAPRDAPHAMIQQGSSGPDVALWQTIIGATPDGIFGSGTAAKTKAWQSAHGRGPDGIVGPLTWATALGSSNAAPPVTVPTVTPVLAPAASSSLALSAAAALAALRSDSNYCASIKRSGTAVNSGVHNFKAAWNAANPSNRVPINTGNYEPSVASALSAALGGVPVPPGCGATASAPAPMPSIQLPLPVTPPSFPTPSAPSAAGIPAALQALLSFDPCNQANVDRVRQVQSALGLTPDGKYGAGTASAARSIVANAPAGCSGPPLWWGTKGSVPVAPPGVTPPPLYIPPVPPMPSAPPSGGGNVAPPPPPPLAPPSSGGDTAPSATSGGGGGLVAPEEKKLSTGAIVVGAIGAVAIVGLISAVAMSGKKPAARRSSGGRKKSTPRKTARKSSHKKTSRKKRR